MPGYRLTIFWDCRLTWKVIVPFSTVSVPMPSTASLAWNILLSVLNLAVYTPSGSAAAGAGASVTAGAGAAVAAGAVSSVETASDVLSAVDAVDAPQPASSRAGRYGIRPYGVARHHIGRRPGMPGPCRAFPKTKKLPGAYPPGRMGLS